MFDSEYLTKEHLIGFDNYKYSCKDTGILSIYVMHPFWNWLVQFFPKWMAPNLITFTGFLFTVATFLMFTIMDYNFYASDPAHPEVAALPKWTFTAAAIFLFLAYTLDGVDGKQARRTGTSGPLGELFDHGLDSYSAGFIPISMYSIFSRNKYYALSPYRMYFMMWNIMINFYTSHFEKYNTGVLFLPWAYDFSMWGTILTFLVTGIFGHQIWNFNYHGINSGTCFEILLYTSALLSNVPVLTYNIYKSYSEKTGKMRTFSEAIRPLLPLLILFGITYTWVLYSPGDFLNKDPRVVYLILGTVFSNITSRLIVAQMSNTRCEVFNWLFIPTALAITISLISGSKILEAILVYSLCVLITLFHLHYGTCLVRQMCRHFRINCFTIRKNTE